MAKEIELSIISDSRGKLTVIENILPFQIKRVYYIYDCGPVPRGGHRHKKTIQALVCVAGSCEVEWSDGKETGVAKLSSPNKLLVVMPEDFHVMKNFSPDAVLLVLASELFDAEDYVDDGY